jgi:Trm5-related predicted tRNA methylase
METIETTNVVTRLSKAEKKKAKAIKMKEVIKAKLLQNKQRRKEKAKTKREEIDNTETITTMNTSKELKTDFIARMRTGMATGMNICIDLSYNEGHSEKELSSLCKQIVLSYAFLKRSIASLHLHVSSLPKDSFIYNHLAPQGLEHWYIDKHEQSFLDIFPHDKIVYLSPDAEYVLEDVETDKVLVCCLFISE